MPPQIKRILLIDDSRADNFVHQRRIKQTEVAAEVIVKENGQEALSYLTNLSEEGCYPVPELVFLDINMPVMNGWEFLDRYDQIDDDCKNGIVLLILTTSVAERDRQKADDYEVVSGFLEKPLTPAKLEEVVDAHFPGHTDQPATAPGGK